jgi:hypothetical protein
VNARAKSAQSASSFAAQIDACFCQKTDTSTLSLIEVALTTYSKPWRAPHLARPSRQDPRKLHSGGLRNHRAGDHFARLVALSLQSADLFFAEDIADDLSCPWQEAAVTRDGVSK